MSTKRRRTWTTRGASILAAVLLASGLLVCGCGSATPQVVVTPMTPEGETVFENGVDFIDDPSLLEGSWLDNWESDIEHRVTLADAVAIVRVTTVRRDTDLEHHDTYHLAVVIDNIRFGNIDSELLLSAREGEGGFGTIAGNDDRLLQPPAPHPDHFILYLKWTRDDDGGLVPRWHLSPAGTAVVQRVNSLIELRRQSTDTRRRVIVHTTTEQSDRDAGQ